MLSLLVVLAFAVVRLLMFVLACCAWVFAWQRLFAFAFVIIDLFLFGSCWIAGVVVCCV